MLFAFLDSSLYLISLHTAEPASLHSAVATEELAGIGRLGPIRSTAREKPGETIRHDGTNHGESRSPVDTFGIMHSL
jgi:hypothetical protein